MLLWVKFVPVIAGGIRLLPRKAPSSELMPESQEELMKHCALLFILFGAAGCSEAEPDRTAQEGAEREPVSQQMQRRLRPPYLDPLGQGELFYDIDRFPPPPEEGNKPYPVKTILITDRTATSISLRWHDRSTVEQGTRLRRARILLAPGKKPSATGRSAVSMM